MRNVIRGWAGGRADRAANAEWWRARLDAQQSAATEILRLRAVLREVYRVAGTTYWDDPSAGVQAIIGRQFGWEGPNA